MRIRAGGADVSIGGYHVLRLLDDIDERDEEIERLRAALEPLTEEVVDLIEDLDPCYERDCSDFHTLSLDLLPAARLALASASKVES